MGSGEWFNTLVLAEDLDLTPSIHMVAYNLKFQIQECWCPVLAFAELGTTQNIYTHRGMYAGISHPTLVSTGYEGMCQYSQLLIAVPVIPHPPPQRQAALGEESLPLC